MRHRKLKMPTISGNKPRLGRIPIAPPTKWFKNKKKYDRKRKKEIGDGD